MVRAQQESSLHQLRAEVDRLTGRVGSENRYLREKIDASAGVSGNHRFEPGPAREPGPGHGGRAHRCDRSADRRHGHRKGTVRARAARAKPETSATARQRELCRASAHAHRERAVRPRAGRVHRCRDAAPRTIRGRRPGNALPRRNRGPAPGAAGQAVARAPGRRVPADWIVTNTQGRHAPDRGH